MSASTLSITANPASARRRPVVVASGKRTGVDFLSTDAGVPRANGIEGGDDDELSGWTDLSHSIRAEAFPERSKDTVRIKKGVVSPRRTKKVVPKPDSPRRRTLLRVFSKNFMLLLVLVGLVQMVRKFALKNAHSSPGLPLVALDLEGRIAELDALVKKMATTMQVQVEVVDKKIGNEVGVLRKELGSKIEEKGVQLGNEMKRLDARSEGLETMVGELRSMNFLTKEELDKFDDQLKAAKGSEEVDSEMNLDDVRIIAKQIIRKEIERHAADGLGMVDYALASSGAMVIKHSEPLSRNGGAWFYMKSKNGVHNEASKMLKPSFGEPGGCFPLKGNNGFVQIRLRTAIIPEAVTLEHVAQSVAFDRSSAPKDCRVSGWLQGHDPELTIGTEIRFPLVKFTYDLEKSNAQTFKVLDLAGSHTVDMIRLDFSSNHGSPIHTCIYRLRVHGHEPNSVSMVVTQP